MVISRTTQYFSESIFINAAVRGSAPGQQEVHITVVTSFSCCTAASLSLTHKREVSWSDHLLKINSSWYQSPPPINAMKSAAVMSLFTPYSHLKYFNRYTNTFWPNSDGGSWKTDAASFSLFSFSYHRNWISLCFRLLVNIIKYISIFDRWAHQH